MEDYITTISGVHFTIMNPKPEDIRIEDIAHALSLMTRANGHFPEFYSVAQHCICCAKEAQARGYGDFVALACLLHDASEAYLSDVTRPVKKDLTYYLEVEDRLQHLLWRHFLGRDITDEENTQVFAVDDDMMSMEFHLNMAETINEDYKRLVRTIDCAYQDPVTVETEFLELFENLK